MAGIYKKRSGRLRRVAAEHSAVPNSGGQERAVVGLLQGMGMGLAIAAPVGPMGMLGIRRTLHGGVSAIRAFLRGGAWLRGAALMASA